MRIWEAGASDGWVPNLELGNQRPKDRITFSSLKQQNYSILAMSSTLWRPASVSGRELLRDGATAEVKPSTCFPLGLFLS